MAAEPTQPTAPEAPTEIPKPGWKAVSRRVMQQFKHDNVSDRAAALTYFGVLAIFPGLLVLVSILGMIGRASVQEVLNNLHQLAPGGVNSFLRTVIQQVQGRHAAAGIAAVAGIVVAIWSASGYVSAFRRAMNAIYNVDEGRPVWVTYPLRLTVTIALLVMLIAGSIMVVVTGPAARQVGRALGLGNVVVTAWDIAKWPVLLVLVSLMISLLYWATPNVRQPSFRWISPGGVLAVVVWLVASGLFALYVSFSGSYNRTYGTLATVVIFLVWLWLTNIAILLGAELNAELERQRLIQAGLPEDTEPYVELRGTQKLDDEETARVEQAQHVRQQTVRDQR